MRTLRARAISFATDWIEGRRKGAFFLYPFSLLWALFVHCKNWLYDHRFLRPKRVFRAVVSVGNIVAGGTGKTPLTLLLAQTFSKRRVAILSRGGGAQGSLADEPALLAKRCPGAEVYLGKDRRVSAERAIFDERELLILDDGFQHRKLARDFDLVLILTKDQSCLTQEYLPRGYLRDSPSRLKGASAIFLNPIESSEELEAWRGKLPPNVPLIGVRLEVSRIVGGPLSKVPVGLFCGIARPESFKKTVRDLGALLVDELILADHEGLSGQDLNSFAIHAKSLGAKALVCTEKDFVKLPDSYLLELPVIYLEMELKITAGHQNWQNLVDKIDGKIDNWLHI